MSHIPQTQIVKAVNKLMDVKSYGIVEFGKKYKLEKSINKCYNDNSFVVTYELTHYDVKIITIKRKIVNDKIKVDSLIVDGYSASDRDAINSLLTYIGIYFCKATINKGFMRLYGTSDKIINSKKIDVYYNYISREYD